MLYLLNNCQLDPLINTVYTIMIIMTNTIIFYDHNGNLLTQFCVISIKVLLYTLLVLCQCILIYMFRESNKSK